MKVTFFSNFINHHQIPLCEAFIRQLGHDNFVFVATEKVPEERIRLGYPDNKQYDYVLTAYENVQNKEKAKELASESDIVIIGSAPDHYIVKRLKEGKITYRYCERYFKKKWNIITAPRYFAVSLLKHKRFEKREMYYLCSSAYTAGDINTFANYAGRAFKWGYFPKVKEYDIKTLIKNKGSGEIKIAWVGRFIGFKHPELGISVKGTRYQFFAELYRRRISGEKNKTVD